MRGTGVDVGGGTGVAVAAGVGVDVGVAVDVGEAVAVGVLEAVGVGEGDSSADPPIPPRTAKTAPTSASATSATPATAPMRPQRLSTSDHPSILPPATRVAPRLAILYNTRRRIPGLPLVQCARYPAWVDIARLARKEVLTLANEEWDGLYVAVGAMKNVSSSLGEEGQLELAQRTLRQLIAEGLVEIRYCRWERTANPHVPDEEIDKVLSRSESWRPPNLFNDEYICFGATEAGQQAWVTAEAGDGSANGQPGTTP
jgi:hypothetical protein